MDRPGSAPPEPDARRRAISAIMRPETPTKWRLVSALPSLRRESRDSSGTLSHSSRIASGRRDSTVAAETPTKKRVSLFVRKRRPTTEVVEQEGVQEEDPHDRFRRAQSTLVKPVVADKPRAREMRRYLQYAAELDDLSFEKLKRFVRPGGIRLLNKEHEIEHAEDNELIGEICLEDFADVDDEDFEFLEEASIGDLEDTGPQRRPSLKLDSQKLRWIDNEEEFAQFFAEVGLDEWFEVETSREVKEFEVGEDVLGEWKKDVEEHNTLCERWRCKAVRRVDDIRVFEREFRQDRRRRKMPS